MIEVEKKFDLTSDEKDRLLHGAQFVGERTFTDVYYDTPDYALTREDKWLRERDGKWELKINRNRDIGRLGDQYEEITAIDEITSRLNLDSRFNLDVAGLERAGCLPFVILVTTRQKYKKENYTIDIDSVTSPGTDFIFQLSEIEAEATDETHMNEALEKLLAFAKKEGLTIRHVCGKVREYLRLFRPEHYEALIEAGVLRRI